MRQSAEELFQLCLEQYASPDITVIWGWLDGVNGNTTEGRRVLE